MNHLDNIEFDRGRLKTFLVGWSTVSGAVWFWRKPQSFRTIGITGVTACAFVPADLSRNNFPGVEPSAFLSMAEAGKLINELDAGFESLFFVKRV